MLGRESGQLVWKKDLAEIFQNLSSRNSHNGKLRISYSTGHIENKIQSP